MGDSAADIDGQTAYSLPFTFGDSDAATPPCVLAAGATLKGNLAAETEIQVQGAVEGDLSSGRRVTVLLGGQVRGRILAPEVVVSGLVIGDVVAPSLLSIRAHGEVRGTVTTASLELDLGGTLAGRCTADPEHTQLS